MTQTPSSIVILTGAGISAESGIRTFRDAGGLWEDHPVEQVATPEGFAADPALVHRFYNLRRAALKEVQPNPAHFALAELEQKITAQGGDVLLVTQNVDDLHTRAGSQNLLHMHGALRRAFCQACEDNMPWEGELTPHLPCPSCAAPGGLRPDIVWFGEMPYYMDRIETALINCDVFVSIGTSGNVYPAAGFVQLAKMHGAQTLELNLEPTQGAAWFDYSRQGKAGTLVPQWVREMVSLTA